MCRWLVYKGDLIRLTNLLHKPTNSLIKQSDHEALTPGCRKDVVRNANVNGDGFGVAWYNFSLQQRAAIFKTTNPAWSDLNLAELAEIVETNLLFSHVRAASPGSVISRENCHPFRFGRLTFMHNGGIAEFRKIRRTLQQYLRDDVYQMINGTTDSETAFATFLNQLPNLNGEQNYLSTIYDPQLLINTMRKTIETILQVQKQHNVTIHSSLNFAVTDGVTIVATRFRNCDLQIEEPPSLYYSYGSDFQMAEGTFRVGRSEPKDTVLIASEPLTTILEDWTLIPSNHMIVAYGSKNGSAVSNVEILPINVDYTP
eukprot:TRINITY_DN3453_c1_g2_i1.p1 TRINITY_DN3453_c1_g2~~TRINITY_DN3453_c1_g2_i1.p1  ORF type:complete len:327 (-),score=162.82 TRINITY_DN3453_c1_g2_i1:116-1057(-)